MPHQPHALWAVLTRALLAVAMLAGLAGCVHVATEPGLPLPERPRLHFTRCLTGYICLTEAEADAFAKWVEQFNEWEAARARLLKD